MLSMAAKFLTDSAKEKIAEAVVSAIIAELKDLSHEDLDRLRNKLVEMIETNKEQIVKKLANGI